MPQGTREEQGFILEDRNDDPGSYEDVSYFSRGYKKHFGHSPT